MCSTLDVTGSFYRQHMGRKPRHDHAGLLHFVTNRGTAQTSLYRSDTDRRAFLALLGQLESDFGMQVLAYVLMGNHYHLILRSCDGRLSESMQYLDGRYARRFNAVHERTGALFQGRFHSQTIVTDAHREMAGRYLHLNPFRAGLVDRPVGYRWSSLDAYVAGYSHVRWLHLDLLDGRSGPEYLVDVAMDAPVGAEVPHSEEAPWGIAPDDGFERSFESWDRAVASAFDVSVDELYLLGRGSRNRPRNVAIALARAHTGAPHREVARRYGLRSFNSVNTASRRLRHACTSDPALAAIVARLSAQAHAA